VSVRFCTCDCVDKCVLEEHSPHCRQVDSSALVIISSSPSMLLVSRINHRIPALHAQRIQTRPHRVFLVRSHLRLAAPSQLTRATSVLPPVETTDLRVCHCNMRRVGPLLADSHVYDSIPYSTRGVEEVYPSSQSPPTPPIDSIHVDPLMNSQPEKHDVSSSYTVYGQ